MAETIEIRDRAERGYLSCDLADLLRLLDHGRCHEFVWSVLELEAWCQPDDGLDVLALEKRIKDSPNGLVMTWPELRELAARLRQIINTVIVGCRERGMIPALNRPDTWPESCELVIQAVDSSYWSVSAKSEGCLDSVKNHFRDWKMAT